MKGCEKSGLRALLLSNSLERFSDDRKRHELPPDGPDVALRAPLSSRESAWFLWSMSPERYSPSTVSPGRKEPGAVTSCYSPEDEVRRRWPWYYGCRFISIPHIQRRSMDITFDYLGRVDTSSTPFSKMLEISCLLVIRKYTEACQSILKI